jgi:hypothetical protein
MRRLRGRSGLKIMYLSLIIMCSWLGVVAHDLPCPADNQMLLACMRSCPRSRVCKGLETRGAPRAAGMRERCCRLGAFACSTGLHGLASTNATRSQRDERGAVPDKSRPPETTRADVEMAVMLCPQRRTPVCATHTAAGNTT